MPPLRPRDPKRATQKRETRLKHYLDPKFMARHEPFIEDVERETTPKNGLDQGLDE